MTPPIADDEIESTVADYRERLRKFINSAPAGCRAAISILDETNEAGLCALLGIAQGTARNWRSEGRGPPWESYTFGVRYKLADIALWRFRQRRGD